MKLIVRRTLSHQSGHYAARLSEEMLLGCLTTCLSLHWWLWEHLLVAENAKVKIRARILLS
jgi:hypothetical protein